MASPPATFLVTFLDATGISGDCLYAMIDDLRLIVAAGCLHSLRQDGDFYSFATKRRYIAFQFNERHAAWHAFHFRCRCQK